MQALFLSRAQTILFSLFKQISLIIKIKMIFSKNFRPSSLQQYRIKTTARLHPKCKGNNRTAFSNIQLKLVSGFTPELAIL